MSTAPSFPKPSKEPETDKKPLKAKKADPENSEPTIISLNTNFILLGDKKDFENIIKVAGERIVVIEFFANWCGPCKMLGNKVEELANLYNGKILVIKVDVDDFEEIALEYDVSAMPTFMIMKNEKKLEQFSSSRKDVLEKTLEKYAGKLEVPQEEEIVKKPAPPAAAAGNGSKTATKTTATTAAQINKK